MVVQNPNNWHWVDKNCIEWAKTYFHEKLIGLDTKENGIEGDKYARIARISSIEGDCEVNQRKGKVISLFDLKIVVSIEGHVNESKFQGSITVPEVAFDSDKDDYQFDISIFKETGKLNEVKLVIRQFLIPQLRDVFADFGRQLLLAHGNDIQVSSDQVTSVFTKSNQASSFKELKKTEEGKETDINRKSVESDKPANGQDHAVSLSGTSFSKDKHLPQYNTTKIHLESSFQVPAIELYNTFLNKPRIEAWTRSPIQSPNSNQDIQLNEEFKLFGGNIIMKYLQGEPGKKLVFNWRLNDWKQNHFSVMDITLHESQEYHETKLVLNWSGIPIGEEDKARSNFEEYYVRSIKLTFGFGAIL